MGILQRLRSLRNGTVLIVENTGDVTETGGGRAVSGYSGPPPRRGQRIVVRNTGDATATGDGDAVSGINYT